NILQARYCPTTTDTMIARLEGARRFQDSGNSPLFKHNRLWAHRVFQGSPLQYSWHFEGCGLAVPAWVSGATSECMIALHPVLRSCFLRSDKRARSRSSNIKSPC